MRWLFALLLIPNLAIASVGEIGKVKGSGAIERGNDSIAAVDGDDLSGVAVATIINSIASMFI